MKMWLIRWYKQRAGETTACNVEKKILHILVKLSAMLACPACASNQRGQSTTWGSGKGLVKHSNLIQASSTVPSIGKSRKRGKRKVRFLATANGTPWDLPYFFHLKSHQCGTYYVKISCRNCNSPLMPSLPTGNHSHVESSSFINWKADLENSGSEIDAGGHVENHSVRKGKANWQTQRVLTPQTSPARKSPAITNSFQTAGSLW